MDLCNTVHLGEGGKTARCTKEPGHVGPHHERVRVNEVHRFAEPLARIQLADRLYLVCPESRQAFVQTILTGARYPAWVGEKIASGAVKRILDAGCGEGAFAAFVWSVNPRVWVDAIEKDAGLRRLAILNAPPGTRIFASWGEVLESERTDASGNVPGSTWQIARWGDPELNCALSPWPGVELWDYVRDRSEA